MVKSKTKAKKKYIGGSFWNDLANLALIPGLATYGAHKLHKNKKSKGGKKSKKKSLKGGFIRGGVPQHFYGSKNTNVRNVYNTEGTIYKDAAKYRGGQEMKYQLN